MALKMDVGILFSQFLPEKNFQFWRSLLKRHNLGLGIHNGLGHLIPGPIGDAHIVSGDPKVIG